MDSSVYNQKLVDLQHIWTESVSNDINDFNKSHRKLISNEYKFCSLLINYHPIIPKIYGLTPKTYYFWHWICPP